MQARSLRWALGAEAPFPPVVCCLVGEGLMPAPCAMDNRELREELLKLARERAQLDAREAEVIAEFDARGLYMDDGMVTTKAWLAHHTMIPRALAGSRVLLAKRMRRMPLMAGALASGVVTEGHARALGRCLTPRTVAAFARDEAMMVEAATTLEVDDYELAVNEWLRLNDIDGRDPGTGQLSHLKISPMLDGRHRLDGELDAEDSAELL